MKTAVFIIFIYLFANPVCVFSQKSLNIHYPVKRTDLTLTTYDGTKLDCTKIEPVSPERGIYYPAIIFCHGFGGSKNDVIPYAEVLAGYGFYTFTYSMRGQGKSTGKSNLMNRTEMHDLMQVVDFVKSEFLVDPNKIGLLGSSQGGIISIMAASYGLDVKCVVADLISPVFASDWIQNGCVKMSLLWSLSYDSTNVRYSDEVKDFRRWILSNRRDKWDSLAYYLPMGRDFADSVKNISVPVLISDSWQDKFFSAEGILEASDSIKSTLKIYLGAVPGHGSDTTVDENVYHSWLIDNWIEYWLYNIQNGTQNQPRITYAVSSDPVNYNHWSYTRHNTKIWPPEGMIDTKFYFHPGKELSKSVNSTQPDTVSFLNDLRDRSLTMQEAMNDNFTGEDFDNKFVKNYIYFETAPLDRDYTMAGTPKVFLCYSSDVSVCQYNFQIWDAYPDGHQNFVTRINYTDRNYYHGTVKEKWIYGDPHAHLFKKGDRIRVYVTNLDNGPVNNFLGTNPYILPLLKRSRNVIYMSGKRQSFINLPLK